MEKISFILFSFSFVSPDSTFVLIFVKKVKSISWLSLESCIAGKYSQAYWKWSNIGVRWHAGCRCDRPKTFHVKGDENSWKQKETLEFCFRLRKLKLFSLSFCSKWNLAIPSNREWLGAPSLLPMLHPLWPS